MARRRSAEKREVLPDPKFGNVQLSKFINVVMTRGKKSVAETIVYGAIDLVEKKAPANEDLSADLVRASKGLAVLINVLNKVKPNVEVRSRRVGGATYQVPVEVRLDRGYALAMRWLRDAARKRGEATMAERLAAEILEAANDRGTAIKKRDDTHKMAEANRAFAHYRW